MTYEQTMAWGARQWADVLGALGDAGLPAQFTQTGGMNAAIVVTLEAGHYLLITDADDSLSWEPSDHLGWFVGLYDSVTGDLVCGEQDDDGRTTEDLLRLAGRVMHAPREPGAT